MEKSVNQYQQSYVLICNDKRYKAGKHMNINYYLSSLGD